MRLVAERNLKLPVWRISAVIGMIAAFAILSFYSVIGGWAASYVGHAAMGDFTGGTAESIGDLFGGLLASPVQLLAWHTVFMALVILVVSQGLKGGLERAVTILMPALFLLLLVAVGYATTTGHFGEAVSFLFTPDFSKLTIEGVLIALGHAFFTLSLGMAIMMAYGSYLGNDVPVGRTMVIVALMDTVVALLAGLAIFPVVFANGLEPSAGPGLIFQTLPLAFGNMPMGGLFGTLFFILLLFAAWTSGISLLEPVVEWAEENTNMNRTGSAVVVGTLCWLLVIGYWLLVIGYCLYFVAERVVRCDPAGYVRSVRRQNYFRLAGLLHRQLPAAAVWFANRHFRGLVCGERVVESRPEFARCHVCAVAESAALCNASGGDYCVCIQPAGLAACAERLQSSV